MRRESVEIAGAISVILLGAHVRGHKQQTNMTKPPIWLWAASGAGLLWNAYGLWQFTGSLGADRVAAKCMTSEQGTVMTNYPAWMTVANGVLGGRWGPALLLAGEAMYLAWRFGLDAVLRRAQHGAIRTALCP